MNRVDQGYRWWSEHCERMDDWWQKRETETSLTIVRLEQFDSQLARNYAHVSFSLARHGRRENAKFWLLTLLQTRASGGARGEGGE